MEKPPEGIIIADNQYLIVRSLSSLIHEKLQMEISQVVSTRYELEEAITSIKVTLLIVDPGHFDFDGIPDLRKTLSLNSSIPVLILTNVLTRRELTELNMIGIKNILFKTSGEEELVTAIRLTLQGKRYHGQEVVNILMEQGQNRRTIQENTYLTGSEIEIVRLIAEGMTTKEIASRKNVSFHTIMTHRKNIFRKLKVNNASELVMYAIRSGIIDTEYQI